ncbi:MAG: histidine kinase [Firmicutes bacterium]|nr:histidine kinase [Bacillota bacterium]
MEKLLSMDYELIAKVLFESYENIYAINLETSAYCSFHESEAYRKLQLSKSGDDFFSDLTKKVNNVVAPEDREYVLRMLSRENLIKGLDANKYYTFVYRIIRDGKEIYHQIRATYQPTDSGMHAFLGILDIDYMVRQEQARRIEEEERIALEDELRMSRIRNFTSQMQPHFLYNALGSIQEVMLIDPERASELLGDFTVHLRSCIRAMVKDEPLAFSQELENVKAYINIEKMRFGDKLRIHYETQALSFSILPLTVQPIVENAIRHGIYGKGVDGGDVYIRSFEKDGEWVVQVEDSGVGFDVEEYRRKRDLGEGDSTGLMNIKFRLEKVMNAAMDIVSEEGKGTTVTVRIPKGGRDESDYC